MDGHCCFLDPKCRGPLASPNPWGVPASLVHISLLHSQKEPRLPTASNCTHLPGLTVHAQYSRIATSIPPSNKVLNKAQDSCAFCSSECERSGSVLQAFELTSLPFCGQVKSGRSRVSAVSAHAQLHLHDCVIILFTYPCQATAY